jgi:ABC-2 type transport system ATP-binding protein
MPAIEASNLTKVYRTYRKEHGLWGAVKGLVSRRYDETRAADQVTFQIDEGEFVGFLGPNGAGKTTVLKMLSGLLNPSSGDARVLGFVPWERRNEMKRQFSLLMGQKNALWWDLPAQESLELNRAIYGIDRERFKKVVDGLSELLEVQHKMNVMVRELSLGERMKIWTWLANNECANSCGSTTRNIASSHCSPAITCRISRRCVIGCW